MHQTTINIIVGGLKTNVHCSGLRVSKHKIHVSFSYINFHPALILGWFLTF